MVLAKGEFLDIADFFVLARSKSDGNCPMEVARCGRKVFLYAAPPLSWASKGGLNEGLKGDAKVVGMLFLFPDPAALLYSCYYHDGKRKHTILMTTGHRT